MSERDAKRAKLINVLNLLMESSDESEEEFDAITPLLHLIQSDCDEIKSVVDTVQPVLDIIQSNITINTKTKRKKDDCDETEAKVDPYLDVIVKDYSEEDFILNFRLSREAAYKLVSQFEISEIYQDLTATSGREPLTAQKHILCFLWFVGNECFVFRDIAARFSITISSLHRVISRVSDFLVAMTPDVMKYPTAEEKGSTKQFYTQSVGLPGVIGVIGRTHIKINSPNEKKEQQINRPKKISIYIQGVANHEEKFMNVFIGYPGSVHDAKILHESSLYHDLSEFCQDGEYIIGNDIYPCLQELIVPYRNNSHLTKEQIKFNQTLGICNDTIEKCFDKLKQRFRLLYYCKLKDVIRMVKVIQACCVLHNLANVRDLQYLEPARMDQPLYSKEECIDSYFILEDSEQGLINRDLICEQLSYE